jgi:hypothetical protein
MFARVQEVPVAPLAPRVQRVCKLHVASVHQAAGVVPVAPHRDVAVLRRPLHIVQQQRHKAEICGRPAARGRVLVLLLPLLQLAQRVSRLFQLLALEEVHSLAHLHLAGDVHQLRGSKLLDEELVALHHVLRDLRGDELGGAHNDAARLAALGLQRNVQLVLLLPLRLLLQREVFIQVVIVVVRVGAVYELDEAVPHGVALAQCEVANHKVQPRHAVPVRLHNLLERAHRLSVLPDLQEGDADVAHNLCAHLLAAAEPGLDGVERHAVHLDCAGELALLVVDVAHVHAQPVGRRIVLVLHDVAVRLDGVGIHLARLLLHRLVQLHTACKMRQAGRRRTAGSSAHTCTAGPHWPGLRCGCARGACAEPCPSFPPLLPSPARPRTCRRRSAWRSPRSACSASSQSREPVAPATPRQPQPGAGRDQPSLSRGVAQGLCRWRCIPLHAQTSSAAQRARRSQRSSPTAWACAFALWAASAGSAARRPWRRCCLPRSYRQLLQRRWAPPCQTNRLLAGQTVSNAALAAGRTCHC